MDGYEVPDMSEKLLDELEADAADKKFRSMRYACQETLDHLKSIRPKVKDIEGFWRYTLQNHVALQPLLTLKDDLEAMQHCTDIELIRDPNDPRPFELVFHFKENPYFTNSTLSKKYSLPEGTEAAPADGSISKEMREFDSSDLSSNSTKIDWKSSETNLCTKYPRKQLEDMEDFEGDKGSFFWYFLSEEDPFSIGVILAQDVLADPIDYFTGRGENSPEDDSDDEDEEDEDEEDEIDLEEEEERSRKRQKTNGRS